MLRKPARPAEGSERMQARYATRWREAAPGPEGTRAKLRALVRHSLLGMRGATARIEPIPFLRGLYCHYVFDDQVERFRELLTGLQAVGRFVDTPTCLRMLRGEKPIDGPYFHLSFDDGFRNIRTNAAPVLAELGIPAIAFVPSAIVGADWATTSHYCLEVTRYPGVIEMLSWSEARELADYGVEVGSHTRTHARLSAVSRDPAKLRDEVVGSKGELEDRLGTECRYISWPYGEAGDIDDRGVAIVREAGYQACFSAVRGSIEPGVSSDMKIPRHHFEVQWPTSHVRYFLSRA